MKRAGQSTLCACKRCVVVATVAALAIGAIATSAHAERVVLDDSSKVVEFGQDATGQEDVTAPEASETPEVAELGDGADQSQQGEASDAGQADAAPEGPKVDPQLDIKGPKVDYDLDIKGPTVDVPKPDCAREYVDESGKVAPHKRLCKELSSSCTGWLPLKAGWYCFSKSVDLSGRAAIEGDVRIILCDGAKVTWTGGLHLCPGSKLTIYGQKEGTGELVADASSRDNEAGIGGNQCESNTEVIICGGHVTAKAGEDAAGIGGGGDKWGFLKNDAGGDGGKVTIYGGEVRAYGNDGGDGIGAGKSGHGCSFTMYGGKVYAKAEGEEADGIRGGVAKSGDKMRILGGEVEVEGGDCGDALYMGSMCFDSGLLIENAKVTATGHGTYGSAIHVSSLDASNIVMRNARVTATSECHSEAIWCGSGADGDTGITIEGASVIDSMSAEGAAFYSTIRNERSAKIDIADHLDVFSLDEGGKKAEKELRAEYCRWRKHVRIQASK